MSQKVKAMDQRNHVLQRPGMYIGSTTKEDHIEFVYDDEINKIVKKNIKYTPKINQIKPAIVKASSPCSFLVNKDNPKPVVNMLKRKVKPIATKAPAIIPLQERCL